MLRLWAILVCFLLGVFHATAFVSRPSSRLSVSVSDPAKAWIRANSVTPRSMLPLNAMAIPFPGNSTTTSSPTSIPYGRFDRSASTVAAADQDCILEIDGQRYNLTKWAKAHPGGVKVLHKFHNKDASKAFHAADHSTAAYAMLKDFWIGPVEGATTDGASTMITHQALAGATVGLPPTRSRPRWIQKLFTREDPIGIHKYMGFFALAHFIFRFGQLYFGDPSAGYGTRLGKGPHIGPALCLIPHAVLALSSLIFHTGMYHHMRSFVVLPYC
eukprot:scaffold27661_cov92-Amphora_coffeaeformis.AAC.1